MAIKIVKYAVKYKTHFQGKTKTPSPHSFTGEFINVGRNSTQAVPEHKYIGNIILSDHH